MNLLNQTDTLGEIEVGKLIEFAHCQHLFDTPTRQLTAAYVSGA